tara:strand:- start:282029 stop:282619 length:591 start_codon:yes stop_codon:yes gene_type:complete
MPTEFIWLTVTKSSYFRQIEKQDIFMDIALLLIGFICMLIGIIGSFLPILPGPPISWVGLLLLFFTNAIPQDWWFLGITLAIAIIVFAMDYVIPAIGTKKFGGSKAGMIGTTVGLLVAIIFPILGIFGIIIWPFVGAFLGEILNKANKKTALKAAFGSFLGFLTGTFLKFMVAIVYLGLFISKAWEYKSALFSYFN